MRVETKVINKLILEDKDKKEVEIELDPTYALGTLSHHNISEDILKDLEKSEEGYVILVQQENLAVLSDKVGQLYMGKDVKDALPEHMWFVSKDNSIIAEEGLSLEETQPNDIALRVKMAMETCFNQLEFLKLKEFLTKNGCADVSEVIKLLSNVDKNTLVEVIMNRASIEFKHPMTGLAIALYDYSGTLLNEDTGVKFKPVNFKGGIDTELGYKLIAESVGYKVVIDKLDNIQVINEGEKSLGKYCVAVNSYGVPKFNFDPKDGEELKVALDASFFYPDPGALSKSINANMSSVSASKFLSDYFM